MTKNHLFFVCFCCRVIGKSGRIQRSSIAIRAGESWALVSSVNCPAPTVSTIGSIATHSLTTFTKHAARRINNWEVNTILHPTHYCRKLSTTRSRVLPSSSVRTIGAGGATGGRANPCGGQFLPLGPTRQPLTSWLAALTGMASANNEMKG